MSTGSLQIVIRPTGSLCCLYTEAIDLFTLGPQRIQRASHVEPDAAGRWFADLSPVTGPILGPFACRSEALAAEQTWLEAHRLDSD